MAESGTGVTLDKQGNTTVGADTTMVRELVGRLVTAMLAAHRWETAPDHGTDGAAARLVEHRDWNAERLHRVPCRHMDDGVPGTCKIATTLERTRLGGAVLHRGRTMRGS